MNKSSLSPGLPRGSDMSLPVNSLSAVRASIYAIFDKLSDEEIRSLPRSINGYLGNYLSSILAYMIA
jgi:hypothetical protein